MTVQAHVGDEKNLHHAGLNQQTCPAHSEQNISTTTPLALPFAFILIILDQQLQMKSSVFKVRTGGLSEVRNCSGL